MKSDPAGIERAISRGYSGSALFGRYAMAFVLADGICLLPDFCAP
jgi:hypothetical protein